MSSRPEERFRVYNKFQVGLTQIIGIIEADVRKLCHDPYEMLIRMVQPVLWLLIFGQAMAHAQAVRTGSVPYLDFMAPGILAQSILLTSIFYGIALIWERDMGILHKILVSPIPRIFLIIGRAFAAGIRGLAQVVVIYVLCLILGIPLQWNLLSLAGVVLMALLIAAIFSTFSLIVATLVKRRERFMGIGQVITLPLFFASNALYPIEIMPNWIRHFSLMNPLTYQVDALRSLMIAGEVSHFGLLLDFGVGIFFFILLTLIATWLSPKILY